MHLSIQLCGLLLYALVSTASSQERDRLWHSTTPDPSTSTSGSPLTTSVVPAEGAAPVAAGPATDTGSVVPEEIVAPAESDAGSSVPASQLGTTRDLQTQQDVLTTEEKTTPEEIKKEEALTAVEGKKEKKDRKWISAPKEETVKVETIPKVEVKEEKKDRKWISAPKEETVKVETIPKEEVKEEKKDRKWISAPKEEIVKDETIPKEEVKEETKSRKWISVPMEEVSKEEKVKEEKTEQPDRTNKLERIDESENISAEISVEEVKGKGKKKKPRKWMSVPGMEIEGTPPSAEEEIASQKESLDLAQQVVVDQRLNPDPTIEKEIDEYSINAKDMELPVDISELLLAAEEGLPLVQETFITKKTTVYVTISDSVDAEPLFVNLTGIRHYTGQERRMMAGCLDLSDLMLTGEETKEVLQRMGKHKYHKLYLSNNNITEFPANTFSPVAFTVRELRLDGNPLASNDQGEASVLQRGGLFHLTELRELNLSNCGLQDMDYFTPWNSNHLEIVDLSNNKLTSVPSNLQFFHKLKKLFLDGNPITSVSELPFALLWNMQVLSLAGCQVATINDDPFRNMDKLKELSLEGNNLTQIGHVRLPRSNSAVKMFLSGNPWHCACEMLNFVEHYHYAIRDIEYIRCASPRWLEGLRTAYLTKEILSLDSVDGDCHSASPRVSSPLPMPTYSPPLRADRLQLLALIVFVLAALFMLCHVLWARKKDKYRFEDERDDIHYIRIEKKPNFK